MKFRNFKTFVKEETNKSVVATFIDEAVPSLNVNEMLEETLRVFETTKASTFRIYISQSGPLNYQAKVKYFRKMFPRFARNIMLEEILDLKSLCVKLYSEGFVDLKIISTNAVEDSTVLNRYNGSKASHGFYLFRNGVLVLPTKIGNIDMVALAKDKGLESFMANVPNEFKSTSFARELFNDIRSSLGLNEMINFRREIKVKEVSERRKEYIDGNLFHLGDRVKYKLQEGTITFCGTNYVILDNKYRCWLKEIQKLGD